MTLVFFDLVSTILGGDSDNSRGDRSDMVQWD